MSKIGRKPITLSSAKVEIKNGFISLSGPKGKVDHQIPPCLTIKKDDQHLILSVEKETRQNRMKWGLHRALLANKVRGIEEGFENTIKIVGLGYKAIVSGKKLVFSLGYSHKIEYFLPEGVEVSVDKSGQTLTLKSIDKYLLGKACDAIRLFRKPEPYKGTGVIRKNEIIRRKAGKAKITAAS